MFELVITTRNGHTHHAAVRDAREADHVLAQFENFYLPNHPSDSIIDASVLDRMGNRISRYSMCGFESF